MTQSTPVAGPSCSPSILRWRTTAFALTGIAIGVKWWFWETSAGRLNSFFTGVVVTIFLTAAWDSFRQRRRLLFSPRP
jgi:hypothetical protein